MLKIQPSQILKGRSLKRLYLFPGGGVAAEGQGRSTLRPYTGVGGAGDLAGRPYGKAGR